jgi:hypothetical protein
MAGRLPAPAFQVLQKRGKSIFPGFADGTEVCDIDDKFTAVKMLFSPGVRAKDFRYPRLSEGTLDHQPALAWAVNDRNLQHATLFPEFRECNTPAKSCSCNYFKFQDGSEIGRNEVEGVNL